MTGSEVMFLLWTIWLGSIALGYLFAVMTGHTGWKGALGCVFMPVIGPVFVLLYAGGLKVAEEAEGKRQREQREDHWAMRRRRG